jgi:hypothetical protein
VLDFSEWFGFMGREAPLLEPGSPYNMQFRTSTNDGIPVKLLDLPVAACSDPSLSCSCGDCPSANKCSTPQPATNKISGCSVAIGPFEVCAAITFRLLKNKDLPFGWKTLCLSSWFLEADFKMNSNYCQNPKSTVRGLYVIWKGYPNFQR